MAKQKCETCGGEYKNIESHMVNRHSAEEGKSSITDIETKIDKALEMISAIIPTVKTLSDKIERIETGGKNDFKLQSNSEDIQQASTSREGVDPRTISIVDEILGEDFGIDVVPNKDNPGFLFTILVPKRLSTVSASTRPIMDEGTGKQKKNERGEMVFEDYWPGDRRSRAIASWQNFDAIKEQCERVRANIVSFYQKSRQPLPEFRLKSYIR